MASCQTAQWVGTSPYVKLTVSEVSSTETTIGLRYTLYYVASSAANTSVGKSYTIKIGDWATSGTYNINGITGSDSITTGTKIFDRTKVTKSLACSCTFGFNLTWSGVYCGSKTASTYIDIGAITSYQVTYNANGGTGAPAAQTKWYGETLTLSSVKPTRSGHTFKGWGTSETDATANYQPASSYTANAAITLYAVWEATTYKVTYNANGGTGAPAAQTKTYGVSLMLSTTVPTRTNYTFKGWAKSATGAVAYQPGGSYTLNAAVILYAVWELSYVLPKVTSVSVEWNSAYQPETGSDGNLYNYVSCGWSWETTNANPTFTVSIYDANETNVHTSTWQGSGNSGSAVLASEAAYLRTDKSYTVQITVGDGGGSTTITRTLAGEIYPIDVLDGGNGIAFGKAAETENVADFAYTAKFTGGIQNIVLLKSNDLNEVKTPNTYVSKNQGASSYANCPITSGTFVLEVMSAGAEGQVFQRLTSTFKYGAHEVYVRHYYQSAWGSWVLVYGGDTGWVNLNLNYSSEHPNLSLGTEMKYLKGRVKDGVLYIKGDVKGITANWTHIATLPDSLLNKCSSLLAEKNRFTGVYNVLTSVALNLQSNGTLWVTTSPTESWSSTYNLTINVAICL